MSTWDRFLGGTGARDGAGSVAERRDGLRALLSRDDGDVPASAAFGVPLLPGQADDSVGLRAPMSVVEDDGVDVFDPELVELQHGDARPGPAPPGASPTPPSAGYGPAASSGADYEARSRGSDSMVMFEELEDLDAYPAHSRADADADAAAGAHSRASANAGAWGTGARVVTATSATRPKPSFGGQVGPAARSTRRMRPADSPQDAYRAQNGGLEERGSSAYSHSRGRAGRGAGGAGAGLYRSDSPGMSASSSMSRSRSRNRLNRRTSASRRHLDELGQSTAPPPPPPPPPPPALPAQGPPIGIPMGPQRQMSARRVKEFHEAAVGQVEKYKEKVGKLQDGRNKLVQENKKLRHLVDELSRDRLEATKDIYRMAAVGTSSKESAESKRRKMEQRRELLEGLEQLDIDDDDDEFDNLNVDENHSWLGHTVARVSRWLRDHYPLEADISYVHSRFGSGISAYFKFYRFLVVNSLFFIVLWGYAFVRQWSRYDKSYGESQGSLPTWTFFSAWAAGSFFFVFALVTCVVFLTAVSIAKWIRDDREVVMANVLGEDTKPHRFAVVALTSWDFSLDDPRVIEDHKFTIGQEFHTLLEEEGVRDRIANRTRNQRILLIARRVVGMLLNLAFLMAGWIAIIVIALNQQGLSDYFESRGSGLAFVADFAAPLATSFINALLPEITFLLTSMEQWDDETTLLKHQMWRLYFGRQLNLVINVITNYSIAQGSSFIGSIPTTFDEEVYACGEDAAGAGLFSLVMTEFFFHKMVALGVYYSKQAVIHSCMPDLKLEEFRVSEGIIWLLYFQSLMWVSVPLYPFGSILSSICLVLNFKFEKLMLTKLRGKPTKTWSARDTSIYFAKFYNVTLLLCFGSYYYFLNSTWDCEADAGLTNMGPFRDTEDHAPWNAVKEEADSSNLLWVYDVLSAPVLYLCVSIAILLRYFFQNNVLESLTVVQTKSNELHWKEVDTLNRVIAQKDRLLRVHRRSNEQDDLGGEM